MKSSSLELWINHDAIETNLEAVLVETKSGNLWHMRLAPEGLRQLSLP